MRSSSQPPWVMGMALPRRRFREAALILSRYWEIAALLRRCPLMGGDD